MTARLGQLTLILTIVAVGYFVYSSVQGSVKVGQTITNTTSSLETGLVGHWTFDGPDMDWGSSTAEVLDISGNGYHATTSAGITATSAPISGSIGQGLGLNGDAQAATINYKSGWDLDFGAGEEFSVSLWMRNDDTTVFQTLLNERISETAGYQIRYSENHPSGPGLFVRIDEGAVSTDTFIRNASSSNVMDGEWHHVVAGRSSLGHFIYADSQLVNFTSDLTLSDLSNTVDIVIGANWNGDVDDVRIYNRTLSDVEITQLYNMGGSKVGKTVTPTGLATGLVGHWTFDGPDMDWGSSTAEALDVSGNGHNGDWEDHSTTTALGKIGQGLSINFSPITVPAHADFTFTDGSDDQPFSVSLWLDHESHGVSSELITRNYWNIEYYGTEERLEFNIFDVGVDSIAIRTTASIPSNEMVHVVATYSGSETVGGMKMYFNGVEQATSDIGSGVYDGLPNTLEDVVWFNQTVGSIDDLRVYDRALSVTEIQQLYGMGSNEVSVTVTPTNPNSSLGADLVGHWTFDGSDTDWSSTTAEIQDASGNDVVGDTVSMSAASVALGVVGQALSFDGSGDYIDLIPDVSASIQPKKTNDFSVSLWCKGSATDGNFISGESGNILVPGWYIRNNSAHFYGTDISLGFSTVSKTFSIPDDDEWHHVVVVLDRGASPNSLQVYIDNVAEAPATGNLTKGYSLSSWGVDIAGTDRLSGTRHEGLLDDVRIYQRGLTAEDVEQLYNMGR